MSYIRGVAANIPFGIVKRTTGEDFIDTDGTPTVYVTKDDGAQAAAASSPVYKGNGQWVAPLTSSEMDGVDIGVAINATDCVSQFFAINTVTGELFGPGGTQYTIAVKPGGVALGGCAVWITSDEAGTDTVAGTRYTDDAGEVTFMLEEGVTYYAWRKSDQYDFGDVDPYEFTVPVS